MSRTRRPPMAHYVGREPLWHAVALVLAEGLVFLFALAAFVALAIVLDAAWNTQVAR